nr:hypothetical protein K-LCC10_0066 [Kaumoebavirus]
MFVEIASHCDLLTLFQLSRTCKKLEEMPLARRKIDTATKEDWITFSKCYLSLREFRKYWHKIDTYVFLESNQYGVEYVKKLIKMTPFVERFCGAWQIFRLQMLPEWFLEQFLDDKVLADTIIERQKLSQDFIIKHINKLDMRRICEHQDLDISFIKRYKNCVEWNVFPYRRDIPQSKLDAIMQIYDEYLEDRFASATNNNIGNDHYGNLY